MQKVRFNKCSCLNQSIFTKPESRYEQLNTTLTNHTFLDIIAKTLKVQQHHATTQQNPGETETREPVFVRGERQWQSDSEGRITERKVCVCVFLSDCSCVNSYSTTNKYMRHHSNVKGLSLICRHCQSHGYLKKKHLKSKHLN